MYKHFIFAMSLVLSQVAFAAASDHSAVVADDDNVVMLVAAKNNWTVLAMNNNNGFTKMREFHDMGDSGVQQIDYVINCKDLTMALASFVVLKANGRIPVNLVEPTFAKLSFYKPVIEHDKNIANNVCDKRMAMNGNAVSN